MHVKTIETSIHTILANCSHHQASTTGNNRTKGSISSDGLERLLFIWLSWQWLHPPQVLSLHCVCSVMWWAIPYNKEMFTIKEKQSQHQNRVTV